MLNAEKLTAEPLVGLWVKINEQFLRSLLRVSGIRRRTREGLELHELFFEHLLQPSNTRLPANIYTFCVCNNPYIWCPQSPLAHPECPSAIASALNFFCFILKDNDLMFQILNAFFIKIYTQFFQRKCAHQVLFIRTYFVYIYLCIADWHVIGILMPLPKS